MFTRFRSLVRDYFGFSPRETSGFLFLLLITLLFLAGPFLYRYVVRPQPVDTSAADQRKLDSLVALMQAEEARQPVYRNRAEGEKTTAERFHEPRFFTFDPNTVSVASWQQLGLPRWMAERIDKYRSKGGRFRRKADLLKIYDFPPDLYEQLEPYISLPEAAPDYPTGDRYARRESGDRPFSNAESSVERRSTDRTNEKSTTYTRPARPVPQPFDINTADTSQLTALRGIGVTLAGRIIKFRDALGGFVSTDQFRDVYGLDSLALQELHTFAKIRSAARRIPVNTASAEELDRLPFLSRRQAQVIVNYREQHGAYTSPESLKPIRILDAQTIEKITPYLAF